MASTLSAPTAARGWTGVLMANRIPKNDFYVSVSADKLVELIKTACPPNTSTVRSRCFTDEDCITAGSRG